MRAMMASLMTVMHEGRMSGQAMTSGIRQRAEDMRRMLGRKEKSRDGGQSTALPFQHWSATKAGYWGCRGPLRHLLGFG
jgi:hypothetical protein